MNDVRSAFVYVIEHIVDGTIYVGKTIDLQQRWAAHQRFSSYKGTSRLYHAMKKHGIQNFIFLPIQYFENETQAFLAERFWIAELRKQNIELYNLTDGGDGTLGYVYTDAHRRKIGRAKKGVVPSLETRQKISISLLGRKIPFSIRLKISRRLTGRQLSFLHCEKISKSLCGHKKTQIHCEHISQSKKNVPLNLSGLQRKRKVAIQRMRWAFWRRALGKEVKLHDENLLRAYQKIEELSPVMKIKNEFRIFPFFSTWQSLWDSLPEVQWLIEEVKQ